MPKITLWTTELGTVYSFTIVVDHLYLELVPPYS